MQCYAHSSVSLLISHVDAIINPGNSGGPVVAESKSETPQFVVGVVCQNYANSGYGGMIPLPILKHFLNDIIRNDRYTGFPEVSMGVQSLENLHLRSAYGMTEEKDSGILVCTIDPKSPAHNILHEEDILLSIDDHRINNNGMINYPGISDNPIYYTYAITQRYMMDNVKFEVLRNKVKYSLTVPLTRRLRETALYPIQHEMQSEYIYRCGLVLQAVTYNVAASYVEGSNYSGPSSFYSILASNKKQPGKNKWKKQFIIAFVVPSPETDSYSGYVNSVVYSINGYKVTSFAKTVFAFDEHKGDTHKLITSDKKIIVVPANSTETEALRKTYGIHTLQSKSVGQAGWRKIIKKLRVHQAIKKTTEEEKVTNAVKLTIGFDETVADTVKVSIMIPPAESHADSSRFFRQSSPRAATSVVEAKTERVLASRAT